MRPSALMERIRSQKLWRACGSSPVVGSSRNSTRGSFASDRVEISTGDVEATLRFLLERGVPLRHLRIRPRNLEDLFLELTGRELRT